MPHRFAKAAQRLILSVSVVGLGVGLVLLVWLDAQPLIWVPSPPPAPGPSLDLPVVGPLVGPLVKSADGLLLLPEDVSPSADYGGGSQAESVSGWLRWALQSSGSFFTAPVTALLPVAGSVDPLASRRFLVVPGPVAAGISQQAVVRVRDFVLGGGALLLELPGPEWNSLLPGLRLGARGSPGQLVPEPPLPPQSFDLFARLRLPVEQQQVIFSDDSGSLEARTGAQTGRDAPVVLLRTSAGPALLRIPLGRGFVLLCLLDVSRLWSRWEQGGLGPSGLLENRHLATQSEVLETNDLVEDPALLTADYPVADLLEELVWSALAGPLLLPSRWHFPAAHPGALLLTHDEEAFGDRASWMAEANGEAGCPSTQLIVPSPAVTRAGVQAYATQQAEVGLHVILTDPSGARYPGSGDGVEGRFQPLGLWKLHPVWRLFSPLEQNRFLADVLGQTTLPTASRTHFLAWPPRAWDFFVQLAEAGIQIDSSYGPDLKNRGFLFGTGRPFHPSGPSGKLLPLYEHPFVSAEDLGGADEAWLKHLLLQSATQTFQAINVLYHPNAFRWHPSIPAWRAWKSLCPEARALGLWVTTLTELARTSQARETSSVWSEPWGEGVRVHWTLTQPGLTLALPLERAGVRYGVEPDAETSAPSRAMPLSAGVQREVQVLGAPVLLLAPATQAGTLLLLPRGPHPPTSIPVP